MTDGTGRATTARIGRTAWKNRMGRNAEAMAKLFGSEFGQPALFIRKTGL